MSSEQVFYKKIVHEDGSILEMKVWYVPISARYPDGIRYSLYLVQEGKVLVGYDNHHPKGHYRHYGVRQEPYQFVSTEQLLHDFNEDRKGHHHES